MAPSQDSDPMHHIPPLSLLYTKFTAPNYYPPSDHSTLIYYETMIHTRGGARGSSSSSAPASRLSSELEHRLVLGAQPSNVARASQSQPAVQQKPMASSSKALSVKFPPRPGYGTLGTRCVIRANHFLVELTGRDLYHYDVSITPEVTSRAVNRVVMKELLEKHGKAHFNGCKPAYDGRKGFYTAGALPFTSKEFAVKLIDKDETGAKKKEREFKVCVKLASRADLNHLRQFLQGKLKEAPHETIQVLDVVLRESPSKNYTVVGRSFFAPGFHKSEIGFGAECWKGFYQSLRPTQMGMSLNMDVSATAFYEPIPVINFVAKFLDLGDPIRAASRTFSESDRIKLKKALRGVKIEVTHGESKRYRVSDITSLPTNQLKFVAEEEKEKFVIHYFQEKYKISVHYGSWPALQSGNEPKPIYLPMELCMIVEGQKYSKKLNERQVTALLREACKRPRDREESIRRIAGSNNYGNDELAKEFGIDVKRDLVCIDARVLPPPVLKYNDCGKDRTIRPYMGQWNMINAKMYNGAQVKFWTCLNFSSLSKQMASGFCKDLIAMCRNKGMDVNPSSIFPVWSCHPNEIEGALSAVHHACNDERKPLELLIIILPDVSGTYGRIKRVCETELGVVSQCCQPKHARRCSPQYLENVALKINVKTGGRNSVLEDAICRKIPVLTDVPTIIFGADVSHPQPGEDSGPSIAAVVASMDWPAVTTYRGLVSSQQHREEIIQDLYKIEQDPKRGMAHAGMVRELLIAFKTRTNEKPQRIIFYRDGVSEGQFSQVLLSEMDAIRKACQSLEDSYLPPVTFIVVQKRHHTRLFPANPGQTDKSGNILPGTVVDRMICHPSEHDFYLCSHAGIQGTSRPVHYHVLFDENKFTADNLQKLTNSLCYTYARCTRSVSVVPPAYYAHLAAFRARYYVEGESASDVGAGTGPSPTVRREALPVRALPPMSPNVKNIMFYC
ncbi:Argonaute family protein [Melia azedarach]|uniref:Argonaute family protein n=1 Tax=Melia azedarach TaxID=155640 RepID=A0ACC1X1K4_MELAZ|nr:Argonaute family protein [Melia azedarach]